MTENGKERTCGRMQIKSELVEIKTFFTTSLPITKQISTPFVSPVAKNWAYEQWL